MTSYETLAAKTQNPLAKRLISIILTKKTNLCVSIDVTSAKELVSIVHKVGRHVCMIKVLLFSESFLMTDTCRHPVLVPRHINTRPSKSSPGVQLLDF